MSQTYEQAPREETNPWPRIFVEARFAMARAAIQGAIVLNSGASAAMLAFVSSLAASEPNPTIAIDFVLVRWALQFFSMGMFLAACTFVVAYLAMLKFQEFPVNRVGGYFRLAAIAMVMASLGHFLFGMGIAAIAITTG